MTDLLFALLSHDWAGLAIAGLVALPGLLLLRSGKRKASRRRTASAWAVLAVASLAALGSIYHLVAMAAIRADHPAPGKLIDVGGYRMHVLAEGDARNNPAVVWLPGGHSAGYAFYHLHAKLREESRSILIDRPGTGWSDPGPFPRTTAREAVEVVAALENAGEKGPFIFVGHSFGGLLSANIARRSPGLVAGLVLLDATPPDTINYGPDNPILSRMRMGAALDGIRRLFGFHPPAPEPVKAEQGDWREEPLMLTIRRELGGAWQELSAIESGPQASLATASIFAELQRGGMGWDETVYDGELGDLPVLLVAPGAMRDDEFAPVIAVMEKARGTAMSELEQARLKKFYSTSRERYMHVSSNTRRIYAPEGTGHNFPYQTPDFVIDIVREMQIKE